MKYSLKKECLRCLQDVFGLADYRPGQKAAVQTLLSGRDLMCILPTGAGKSLCWQLPALVHEGLTVVVSPLISLMRDQVEHLVRLGIPAVSLDSLMSWKERRQAMAQIRGGEVRIVFVSPERLEQPGFRQLCMEVQPWLLVADEAHCVVQWGESFRPAYGSIAEFIGMLPVRPAVCALTATADKALQQGIRASLGLRDERCILLPILRENLVYEAHTTLDRTGAILRLLMEMPCKTVIFCRSRARTEALAERISAIGLQAEFYHAGLERQRRLEVQKLFADGKIEILCATSAFGMGVDIPDIRRVIHDELPDSVIDYVQQSGRAGRDGRDAHCIAYLEPGQMIRRGYIRMEARSAYLWQPVKRWLYARKMRRNWRELLKVMFASRCIAGGISRVFGGGSVRCGRCSACRGGVLLTSLKGCVSARKWRVRAFLLRWQRDALAKLKGSDAAEVMSDAALRHAAKKLAFPADALVPAEMARLLENMQQENGNDSAQKWIS